MTITIEISPELEQTIKQAATQAGLSLDAYILESVTARLPARLSRHRGVPRFSAQESDLLQKINQSLSQIEWKRYRELGAKRQAEVLTDGEQEELIALSNQIEEANATRIEYVAKLAEMRKTTLPAMMKELGLKPVAHL